MFLSLSKFLDYLNDGLQIVHTLQIYWTPIKEGFLYYIKPKEESIQQIIL